MDNRDSLNSKFQMDTFDSLTDPDADAGVTTIARLFSSSKSPAKNRTELYMYLYIFMQHDITTIDKQKLN